MWPTGMFTSPVCSIGSRKGARTSAKCIPITRTSFCGSFFFAGFVTWSMVLIVLKAVLSPGEPMLPLGVFRYPKAQKLEQLNSFVVRSSSLWMAVQVESAASAHVGNITFSNSQLV